MWCVNPMTGPAWTDPHSTEHVEETNSVFLDREVESSEIKENRLKSSRNIFRSSSCNRGGPKNSKSKRRPGSSSSFREDKPTYRSKFLAKNLSLGSPSEVDKPFVSPKKSESSKRNSFTDNVFTKLARQYSLSRSTRRASAMSTKNPAPIKDDLIPGLISNNDSNVVYNKRERRRKIGVANNAEENSKQINEPIIHRSSPVIFENKNTFSPQVQPKGIYTTPHTNITSSDSSCPNSPIFPSPPASPNRVQLTPSPNSQSAINRSSFPANISQDEFKDPDSGRPMSLGSLRGFKGGRPTSLSSVTSSISSRTSRGSDYFSSASSGSNEHQFTSFRHGSDLPALDESDSLDRFNPENATHTKINSNIDEDEGVGGDIEDEEGEFGSTEDHGKSPSKLNKNIDNVKTQRPKDLDEMARKRAVFAAHDMNNDINSVDHLAPVSTVAMIANPDLSYVDRVILELLETERMYVKSMMDILSGYLAAIRGHSELNICREDVSALFGNIRDVYDFNRNLLLELEKCYGDPVQVAQCFVSQNDIFSVYSDYCTNYPSSVSAMTRCMRNPNVARFFKEQQDKLKHTLPLGSYLLKPVQRILKYHLLLQELVKNCDKEDEGFPIIQHALSTMTRIARDINDMKKKHEDAVHIQEIQSLLTCWQGNELTTYGELVLEAEMRLLGAKNLRQVFLFDKLLLVTKRNEDGYLVCKINILCSDLMLLESVENNPCAFHILPFERNTPSLHPTANPQYGSGQGKVQQYTLIAPIVEEKKLWTHHIKRLIIENHHREVPLGAKQNIMRMKPIRDEDKDKDSQKNEKIKEMPRYGSMSSNALLGGGSDNKPLKRSLTRFGGSSSASLLSGSSSHSGSNKKLSTSSAGQGKVRRRSDSSQKKGLHIKGENERKASVPLLPSEMGRKTFLQRALRKRAEEVESSDDISSDSVPTTPSNTKITGSKFSFPILRNSVGRLSTGQLSTSKLALPKQKSSPAMTPNSAPPINNNSPSSTEKETKKPEEEAKPKTDGRVVYRRHKRRTSQPITFVEKRQSMKVTEEDAAALDKEIESANLDDEDYFKLPLALTPRQSVSWDIQIVDAVFERYKRESSMSVTSNTDHEKEEPVVKSPEPRKVEHPEILEPIPDLGSTYLTVPGDVAPSPLYAYKHSANLKDRRKSRIQVLSSDTSDNEVVGTPLIQRKPLGKVQEKDVESDGSMKPSLRVRKAKAESRRASMVIHDSDTDVETKIMMKEKAVAARRKHSLRRRERNARKTSMSDKNINTNNNNNNNNKIPNTEMKSSISRNSSNATKSIYDNVPNETEKVESDSIEVTKNKPVYPSGCATTVTSSMSITTSRTSPPLLTQDMSAVQTSPSNNTARKEYLVKLQEMREKRLSAERMLGRDAKSIQSGKVQGLIKKIKNIEMEFGSNVPLSPTSLMSPTEEHKHSFTFPTATASSPIQETCSPTCKLIHSTTFDPSRSHSVNTVTTTVTTSVSSANTSVVAASPVLSTSIVPIKETNLSKNETYSNNEKSSPINRQSVVTTLSLPLTLTSGSSSESSDEEESLVKKVNRLSKTDSIRDPSPSEEDDESKSKRPKEIFLRRSVSMENGSKNRRSTNLVLEARLSGENHDDVKCEDQRKSHEFTENDAPMSPEVLNVKQSNEQLEDAKMFLFEKLCAVKPDFKMTDDMSEEVDHVWSDQEKTIRTSSFESPALSANEDDNISNNNENKLMVKKLNLPVSPLVPKRIEDHLKKNKVTKDNNKDKELKNTERKNESNKKSNEEIQEEIKNDDNKRRNIKSPKNVKKSSPKRVTSPESRHVPVIMQSRTESMRSTRSEYTPRLTTGLSELGGRGRSSKPTNRTSLANPRDIKVIPHKNVHALAEKFNRNTSPLEKDIKPRQLPKRSRSVGNNLGRRRKQFTRSTNGEDDIALRHDKKVVDAKDTPQSKPVEKATCKVTSLYSASVRAPLIVKKEVDKVKSVQKANNTSISVPTKTTSEKTKVVSVEQGKNSVRVSLVNKDSDEEEDVVVKRVNGDDQRVNDKKVMKKQVSLVEMFAANPKKQATAEVEIPETVKDDNINEESLTKTSGEKHLRYSQMFAKTENGLTDNKKTEEADVEIVENNLENNVFYFGRRRYASCSDDSDSKNYKDKNNKVTYSEHLKDSNSFNTQNSYHSGDKEINYESNNIIAIKTRRKQRNNSFKTKRQGLIIQEPEE